MPSDARTEDVTLVAQGDADALQRLLVHYHVTLRRHVDRIADPALRHRVEPEDVLQQAYVAAYEALAGADDAYTFDHPGHFYKWLEQIATNKLRDLERSLRRQKRDVTREATNAGGQVPGQATSVPQLIERVAARDATPSVHLRREEAAAAMLSSLARLSPSQRTVVRMRFLEGVPFDEIARRMGKTETAVYALCHRGLKALRERLNAITQYLTGI
jgi:RNA polymerase sigma-70 factor (ECF subfamily)